MASLSTCHLELVVWDGNLVKSFDWQYPGSVVRSLSCMPFSVLFDVDVPSHYCLHGPLAIVAYRHDAVEYQQVNAEPD